MRFRSLICALLLICAPCSLFGQGATVQVAYTIAAATDGNYTTDFNLKIDGAQEATKPVSALSSGAISFSGTKALAPGAHTAEIEAVGPGGTVKQSGTFTVTAPPPTKPGTVTIVITIS